MNRGVLGKRGAKVPRFERWVADESHAAETDPPAKEKPASEQEKTGGGA